MKNFNKWILFIVLFTGLLLNACQDNNNPITNNYKYYLSSELKFIIGGVSGFIKKVLVPLTGIASVLERVEGLFNRKKKKSETSNK